MSRAAGRRPRRGRDPDGNIVLPDGDALLAGGCPGCGYLLLRTSRAGTCPRCGNPLCHTCYPADLRAAGAPCLHCVPVAGRLTGAAYVDALMSASRTRAHTPEDKPRPVGRV